MGLLKKIAHIKTIQAFWRFRVGSMIKSGNHRKVCFLRNTLGLTRLAASQELSRVGASRSARRGDESRGPDGGRREPQETLGSSRLLSEAIVRKISLLRSSETRVNIRGAVVQLRVSLALQAGSGSSFNPIKMVLEFLFRYVAT